MNSEISTIQQGNIKQDIETIKAVFFKICDAFGKGMSEKFYERQMAQFIFLKRQKRIGNCLPDAIYKDNIIIEYKAYRNNKQKNVQYQVRKYLKHTNAALVILMNFNSREFDVFY
jgi:PD-(D/E)XK nuclease superfamily